MWSKTPISPKWSVRQSNSPEPERNSNKNRISLEILSGSITSYIHNSINPHDQCFFQPNKWKQSASLILNGCNCEVYQCKRSIRLSNIVESISMLHRKPIKKALFTGHRLLYTGKYVWIQFRRFLIICIVVHSTSFHLRYYFLLNLSILEWYWNERGHLEAFNIIHVWFKVN